jgi:hypothetical protein
VFESIFDDIAEIESEEVAIEAQRAQEGPKNVDVVVSDDSIEPQGDFKGHEEDFDLFSD